MARSAPATVSPTASTGTSFTRTWWRRDAPSSTDARASDCSASRASTRLDPRRRAGRALRARPRLRPRRSPADSRRRARRAALRRPRGARSLRRAPSRSPASSTPEAATAARGGSARPAGRRAPAAGPASTTPPATIRRCSRRARVARLPAAECEALSGLCNAHFFEQRLPEMEARSREAYRTAERLGAPHHLAEARVPVPRRSGDGGPSEGRRPALDARSASRRRRAARYGGPDWPRLPRLRSLLSW